MSGSYEKPSSSWVECLAHTWMSWLVHFHTVILALCCFYFQLFNNVYIILDSKSIGFHLNDKFGLSQLIQCFLTGYCVLSNSHELQALGLLFLLFASWLAYVMFEDTIQGKTVFTSYGTTLYQIFILFTTSNNPDVWVPAYKWVLILWFESAYVDDFLLSIWDILSSIITHHFCWLLRASRWYSLFFILFVLLGVYFVTNLVLAVVYDSFKSEVNFAIPLLLFML